MSEILPPAQVWPSLRARDARGLIKFLVEAFGFEEGLMTFTPGSEGSKPLCSLPLLSRCVHECLAVSLTRLLTR